MSVWRRQAWEDNGKRSRGLDDLVGHLLDQNKLGYAYSHVATSYIAEVTIPVFDIWRPKLYMYPWLDKG